MAIAYVPGVFRYILLAEREAAKEGKRHTVFLLKALTAREMEEVEGSLKFKFDVKGKEVGDGSASQDVKPGEKVNAFLRIALRGWENFDDPDGEPVTFEAEKSTGMASWDSIDKVVPFRYELYNAIEDGNKVSGDEAKNWP
jgi:hypothetical protein